MAGLSVTATCAQYKVNIPLIDVQGRSDPSAWCQSCWKAKRRYYLSAMCFGHALQARNLSTSTP
jgi:hypothetical protein